MPQPPEGLTALQQNRLEAARERVLGFRNQVADGILQAAGLEKYGRENYSFHLGRIAAWDTRTTDVLGKMGLAAGGMMTVPVLTVGAKDGDLESAAKEDRFRLKFKDWKEIPIFGLGFETEDHSFSWLYDIELSTLSKNFDEQELKCLGISTGSAFGFTLPEGARNLFNISGWLKTDIQLEPLVRSWARRVDLSRKSLSFYEKQPFTQALSLLERNSPDIQEWLMARFGLFEDKTKFAKLDGDIRIDMVQLEDASNPGTYGTIICIRDILLPEPNSKAAWAYLVRPKADSLTGTLKIIIYSDGSFVGKVTKGVVEQKGYNTEHLVTTENLAAILAKIKVE